MTYAVETEQVNQKDYLLFTVDSRSEKLIFHKELEEEDGRYFVNVYDDGFAKYGHLIYKDREHGNQPYVWGCSCETVNRILNLDEKHQITECSIKEVSKFNCFCAGAILKYEALKCAEYNQRHLQYGIRAFFDRLFDHPEVRETFGLRDGMFITKDSVRIGDTHYRKVLYAGMTVWVNQSR